MKFSVFSLLALAASSIVSAVDANVASPEASIKSEQSEQTPFLYSISYVINNQPEDLEVAEFNNGDVITLTYDFGNNEDEEVTVVGVGGSFRDAKNGNILANVTDGKVGPLVIPSGESRKFSQKIGIDLPANNYALVPGIYVVKGSSLALVGAKSKFAIVSEKPISFFAPQLIILELLLVATIGVGAYFVWINFGAAYFKSVNKTASAPTPSKSRSGTPVVAQTTGSSKKTIDESWLPEGHIKKTTNKRKAK
jgi:hypothetical protein